jgi:hypothetical protein
MNIQSNFEVSSFFFLVNCICGVYKRVNTGHMEPQLVVFEKWIQVGKWNVRKCVLFFVCNVDFIIIFGWIAIGGGWCHIYERLKKFCKEMIGSYAMEDKWMARGQNKRREHGWGDRLKYNCVGCWKKK